MQKENENDLINYFIVVFNKKLTVTPREELNISRKSVTFIRVKLQFNLVNFPIVVFNKEFFLP